MIEDGLGGWGHWFGDGTGAGRVVGGGGGGAESDERGVLPRIDGSLCESEACVEAASQAAYSWWWARVCFDTSCGDATRSKGGAGGYTPSSGSKQESGGVSPAIAAGGPIARLMLPTLTLTSGDENATDASTGVRTPEAALPHPESSFSKLLACSGLVRAWIRRHDESAHASDDVPQAGGQSDRPLPRGRAWQQQGWDELADTVLAEAGGETDVEGGGRRASQAGDLVDSGVGDSLAMQEGSVEPDTPSLGAVKLMVAACVSDLSAAAASTIGLTAGTLDGTPSFALSGAAAGQELVNRTLSGWAQRVVLVQQEHGEQGRSEPRDAALRRSRARRRERILLGTLSSSHAKPGAHSSQETASRSSEPVLSSTRRETEKGAGSAVALDEESGRAFDEFSRTMSLATSDTSGRGRHLAFLSAVDQAREPLELLLDSSGAVWSGAAINRPLLRAYGIGSVRMRAYELPAAASNTSEAKGHSKSTTEGILDVNAIDVLKRGKESASSDETAPGH